MYYDTTENTTKIYSNSVWNDLGGGGEPGQLPTYTSAQRDALSPAEGQQIYNTTENKVQVFGQAAWKTVYAKLALAATCSLDGDCDSTHCVDGVCCDTACSGMDCQTCGSLSSAGLGYCGYVNNSSNDPRNTCATATPDTADSCKSPNCSGTGYACGYLVGEQNQPTCKRCSGSSHDPVNIATGSQDTEGTNLCTATHYRCDSAGNCTNPCSTSANWVSHWDRVITCTSVCSAGGYCGCQSLYSAEYGYITCDTGCPNWDGCSCLCLPYQY